MGVVPAVVVYVMLWWVAFFCVLPIGVRSQEETGEVAPGTEAGAPAQANLPRKMLWATGLSAVLWVIAVVLIQFDLLGLSQTSGFGS